jgi:2-succinyl-5-enolpyruvyl-6-hydroxy-3-cyclohexene-1-carboxylate synthase
VQHPLLLLVCDNQGGRIFDQLPLHRYAAALGPVYAKAVSTPPGLSWQELAHAHGIAYHAAHNLSQLQQALAQIRAASCTPGGYAHLVVCHTDSVAEQAWSEALCLQVGQAIL